MSYHHCNHVERHNVVNVNRHPRQLLFRHTQWHVRSSVRVVVLVADLAELAESRSIREVRDHGRRHDLVAVAAPAATVTGVIATIATSIAVAVVTTGEVEGDLRIRHNVGVPSLGKFLADRLDGLLGILGGIVTDVVDVEVEHVLREEEHVLERLGGRRTGVGVDELVAARDAALQDVGLDLGVLADGDDVEVRRRGPAVARHEAHAVLGADDWEEDRDIGLSEVVSTWRV